MSNRTILHVDDDPLILRMVADQLEAQGYSVISRRDPTLTIATLVAEDCRVVILDVEMPEMNGLEVLRQVKHFDGGIQVVMLTGLDRQSTVLDAMRSGAEACFFKPLRDYQPLFEAVDAAFQKIDGWHRAVREFSRRQASSPALPTPVC